MCVVEKGHEVGAHILSGNVFETRALDELIPDWKEKGAPASSGAGTLRNHGQAEFGVTPRTT